MKDNLLPVLKRLPLYGKVAYDLYRTENLAKKIILGAGLAYVLSPVDLVPGIIPVLGQFDDVLIALSALRKVLQFLPPETRNRRLARYGLRMGDLEQDLELLKQMAGKLVRRTFALAASGMLAAGKMAVKGALFSLRGSCWLARETLVKGGRREKQK